MAAQTDDSKTQEILRKEVKALIEALKEGVIIIDSEQKIIEINKAAADLTGFSQAEAINHPVRDILNLLDEENKEIHPDMFCPRGEIDMEGVIYKKAGLNLVDRKDYVRVVDFESKKVKGGSHFKLGCIVTIDNISQKRIPLILVIYTSQDLD